MNTATASQNVQETESYGEIDAALWFVLTIWTVNAQNQPIQKLMASAMVFIMYTIGEIYGARHHQVSPMMRWVMVIGASFSIFVGREFQISPVSWLVSFACGAIAYWNIPLHDCINLVIHWKVMPFFYARVLGLLTLIFACFIVVAGLAWGVSFLPISPTAKAIIDGVIFVIFLVNMMIAFFPVGKNTS